MAAAAVHANVGLFHATMAIFNAWCDRMPVLVIGAAQLTAAAGFLVFALAGATALPVLAVVAGVRRARLQDGVGECGWRLFDQRAFHDSKVFAVFP